MEQGIYSLLKNMLVIDSLKTPNDAHYSNYRFDKNNDTVLLGYWGYSKNRTTYFQPFLTKVDSEWKFNLYIPNITRKRSNRHNQRIPEFSFCPILYK